MQDIRTIYDLNDAYNHARRDNKPGGARLEALEKLHKVHERICDRWQLDCIQCHFERTAI